MIDANSFVKSGYTVNSQGYRAPEFDSVDWASSYVIQGCSACFGVGIEQEADTVASQLGKRLGSPVINLGVSGSSIQFQLINAVKMLEEGIRPKGVFIIWPSPDRYVYLGNEQFHNIGPWSDDKYLDWALDNNAKAQSVVYARAYMLLWKLAGVPLITVSHHYVNCELGFTDTYLGDFIDRGTDGQHWGPQMAEHVASVLYQKHQSSL